MERNYITLISVKYQKIVFITSASKLMRIKNLNLIVKLVRVLQTNFVDIKMSPVTVS